MKYLQIKKEDSVLCPEERFMKAECAIIKKEKKIQIHGFCAIPVSLDYTADKTTPTVFHLVH